MARKGTLFWVRRFAGFRCRRFRGGGGFAWFSLWPTRFFASWLVLMPLLMRMVMLLRMTLALRLNPAQSAAQFVQFALIRQLLPFGDFDQFQHFIHLVVQFVERFGNERGVFHRLSNGCGCGGTKICRLYPLPLVDGNPRRWLRGTLFVAGFATLLAAFLAARFTPWLGRGRAGRFHNGFNRRFRIVRRLGLGGVFVGVKTFRSFRMRLAKSAGAIRFRFVMLFRRRGAGCRFSRFRLFDVGHGFFARSSLGFGCRTRTTTTATTAAAAATTLGTAGRWIQIGV